MRQRLPTLPAVRAPGCVSAQRRACADAVLFMLTTSLSQDLYKRFVSPGATDQRVLRVARWTALAAARDWDVLVGELLEQHYDPTYARSLDANFSSARRGPGKAANTAMAACTESGLAL